MLEFVALGGALDPEGRRPGIGGSAYALIKEDVALLVDCGLYPGEVPEEPESVLQAFSQGLVQSKPVRILPDGRRALGVFDITATKRRKQEALYEWQKDTLPSLTQLEERGIKQVYLIVTHAHGDHAGAVPFFVEHYPNTPIFLTAPTRDLAELHWNDSLEIWERMGQQNPLFSDTAVRAIRRKCSIVPADAAFQCPPFDIQLFPAGHILGAVSLLVTIRAGHSAIKVFMSGDISFHDQHSVSGAPQLTADDLGGVDYVVTESTNGGRDSSPRQDDEPRLVSDIESCLANGGKFLLGAFAMARAQVLTAILDRHGISKKWPVYIDGRAQDYEDIYRQHTRGQSGFATSCIMKFDRRKVVSRDEPCVVIAPAGMYNGGPSVTYAKAFLPNARNVVAITSYQDRCSPGYQLARVNRGSTIEFGGQLVTVNATIKTYQFAVHAGGRELAEMINRLHPSGDTFLVHGDEREMDRLAMSAPNCVKTIVGTSYRLD